MAVMDGACAILSAANTRVAESELRRARAAVAELIEAARKLQLDRVGIANAEKSDCKLVAPMLDLKAVLAFNGAVARIGGAK